MIAEAMLQVGSNIGLPMRTDLSVFSDGPIADNMLRQHACDNAVKCMQLHFPFYAEGVWVLIEVMVTKEECGEKLSYSAFRPHVTDVYSERTLR